MKTTYRPQDLTCLDGMLAAIIRNGSGFVHTPHGDQIYVPSRHLEAIKAEVGDGVRCWCLANEPDATSVAKYRAIRTQITYRLTDMSPPPPPAPVNGMAEALAALQTANQGGGLPTRVELTDPIPAPAPVLEGRELEEMINRVFDQPYAYRTTDVHRIICEERPAYWSDEGLKDRIIYCLKFMNTEGDLASIRVFADADQEKASYLYYCRSAALAVRIINGGK